MRTHRFEAEQVAEAHPLEGSGRVEGVETRHERVVALLQDPLRQFLQISANTSTNSLEKVLNSFSQFPCVTTSAEGLKSKNPELKLVHVKLTFVITIVRPTVFSQKRASKERVHPKHTSLCVDMNCEGV